jgi:hypothetical protein
MAEEGATPSPGVHPVQEMTQCYSQKHFEFTKIPFVKTMNIDWAMDSELSNPPILRSPPVQLFILQFPIVLSFFAMIAISTLAIVLLAYHVRGQRAHFFLSGRLA